MTRPEITLRLRGCALGLTGLAGTSQTLRAPDGTPLPLISAAEITAAKHCPAAALALQDKRAARRLQIYQAALTLAHLISRDIERIETAQIEPESDIK